MTPQQTPQADIGNLSSALQSVTEKKCRFCDKVSDCEDETYFGAPLCSVCSDIYSAGSTDFQMSNT